MNRQRNIEAILKSLPDKPGCYQYLDDEGTVIYVGKAKNLKKRVNSYFVNKKNMPPKTRALVSKINDIKYVVVDTEADTLLLENNLIKEYRPRYNVIFKDDKTYPSIVIKNEYYPRVLIVRSYIAEKKDLLFGPYTNAGHVKMLIETIHKLYPIRTCSLNLAPEKTDQKKYKVCLEYHLKRCKAPCIGLQSLGEYNKNIENIKEILKGNAGHIKELFYNEMIEYAEKQEYEKAQELKDKISIIDTLTRKSTIISNIKYNIDVYSYEEDDHKSVYINYLSIHNGSIIRGFTFEYKKQLDESKEELLAMGIAEMISRFDSHAKEIVVPFYPDCAIEGVEFTIPQRGEKRELLMLSIQNAKQYKFDKIKKREALDPGQRSARLLNQVKKDLHLKDLPVHIECFDNSNIQGTNPVSSCVVFKMGKPSKKDYRHFNVKTVEGPDDFATMREVVFRRYSRILKENESLPQLIVIDGGKGQLNAACESLKSLDIYGKVAIIGIAKRLEELYFPEDSIPLYLDKSSETLKLIQNLRDEAHRFGITFHRKKRSNSQLESELDYIKGIGEETKKILLSHFKSVKRIKETNATDIEKLIGKHKASLIVDHFKIERI